MELFQCKVIRSDPGPNSPFLYDLATTSLHLATIFPLLVAKTGLTIFLILSPDSAILT